jgi:hypothetical protein
LVPLEMSTIDIEAPGADEAALKAAIQALIPISTTTISSPVNYVDITLPSGYSAFRLEVVGLYRSAGDTDPIGAFSQNGGTTWLEDWDTDFIAHWVTAMAKTGGPFTPGQYEDATLVFGRDLTGGATAGQNIAVMIYPGSASRPAMTVATFSSDADDAAGGVGLLSSVCRISTARVNALRIMPNGSNPSSPSVIRFLNAGTLTLYGVP